MTLLAALALTIWLYLLTGHGDFWQFGPVLRPIPSARAMPPVTIVVPARNEAETIEACLRSLLAQDYDGPVRVILVDDLSSDGTGPLAEAIGDPRLTVLRGAAHPAGWSGKLWAVHQGIAAAGEPGAAAVQRCGYRPPAASSGHAGEPSAGRRSTTW